MKEKSQTKRRVRRFQVPKTCYFCVEKKDPTFIDSTTLQRFLSERGKIVGRVRSGICAKHQRRLTVAIKHARHLALLPFLVRI